MANRTNRKRNSIQKAYRDARHYRRVWRTLRSAVVDHLREVKAELNRPSLWARLCSWFRRLLPAVAALLIVFALPAHSQTLRVGQYASSVQQPATKGKMATAAKAACSSTLPCVLIFEPELAAFPVGVMPARGANEVWFDYTTSGSVSISGQSAVIYVDANSPGVDACAKITAAEALLPSTGGIVDARGLFGSPAQCASSFSVGANQKGVTLLLGYVILQVPNTVTVWGASAILCPASNNAGPFPCLIEATSGFPINTTLLQVDNSQVTFSVTLMNLGLGCIGITGCRGLDTGQLQDTGLFSGMWITDYMAADGGCVKTGNAALTENFTLERMACVAAAGASGVTSISLNGVGDHFYLNNVSVVSKSASPQTSAITCNGCNLVAASLHVENHTDGVLFTGSGGTSSIQEIDGLLNITNVVHIASSFTGNATIAAIKKNSATNSVKNDIATTGVGGTCTDENLGFYDITSTPDVRTSCTSLPDYYTSAAGRGFVFTNGNGMRIIDNTPGNVRTVGIGPNVAQGGAFGWYDYTGSRAGFYCNWTTPYACTFPGDIKLGNLLLSATAPTISSGFGGSPSIVSSNGAAVFTVNVGTGGVATSGVIGLPAATTGWVCSAFDVTNPTLGGGYYVKQTAGTTTTATLSGFNSSGALTAWTASDILRVSCSAY